MLNYFFCFTCRQTLDLPPNSVHSKVELFLKYKGVNLEVWLAKVNNLSLPLNATPLHVKMAFHEIVNDIIDTKQVI